MEMGSGFRVLNSQLVICVQISATNKNSLLWSSWVCLFICMYVCIYRFPATVVHLLPALTDASAPMSNANIQRSPAATAAA
jgi:hypothetical protein